MPPSEPMAAGSVVAVEWRSPPGCVGSHGDIHLVVEIVNSEADDVRQEGTRDTVVIDTSARPAIRLSVA